MTEQEKSVLNKTTELWNEFMSLPIMHPDDQNDIRFHIHAIQNIIYGREGKRSIEKDKEELFYTETGSLSVFGIKKFKEWGIIQ